MKRIVMIAVVACGATVSANATLYTTNWNSGFVNGTLVLDNNASGWIDARSVNAPVSGTIQSLSVMLNLSGGWNGDLYAYLVHDTGFSVLLDRVGYSGSGFGYGDSGFDVTLTLAGNPIESYLNHARTFNGSGQLLGTWAAHSGLESFVGLTPNGMWTLFIADLSAGSMTTVQEWGLQMDIVAVPEMETWIAAALAGAFGAFWLNRQIWGATPPRPRPNA